MTLLFLLPTLALIGALVWLFLWSLRGAQKAEAPSADATRLLEQTESRHAAHCSQIRQALSQSDLAYLAAAAGKKLSRTVRRERHRVVVAYLTALRGDFLRLLCVGRIIAKLSPQVVAVKEFERWRLTAQFLLRIRLIHLRLLFGMTALPEIAGVSDLVSHLAVRIDAAIKELAERVAQASQLSHPSTGAV
jgi:hypothetical protein